MALGNSSFPIVGFFDCMLADARDFELLKYLTNLLYLWVKTLRSGR